MVLSTLAVWAKATFIQPKTMAKLWKWSGLSWEMIWHSITAALLGKVSCHIADLLLPTIKVHWNSQAVLFTLRQDYFACVFSIQAWGFSSATWWICSHASWRQCYGKSAFWMHLISRLHGEIREELLPLTSPAQHYKTSGTLWFFFPV